MKARAEREWGKRFGRERWETFGHAFRRGQDTRAERVVRQSEVRDMLRHRIVPVDQAVADQDGKQHGQERLGA